METMIQKEVKCSNLQNPSFECSIARVKQLKSSRTVAFSANGCATSTSYVS